MPTSNLNKIDARMQQKHDIAANWRSSDFVPEAGEYIIYDPDEHTQFPRMKIGDGKTKVPNLPFVSEIYVQPDEPADAEDGAIWIDSDSLSQDIDPTPDWYQEEGQAGFIRNKPVSRYMIRKTLTCAQLVNGAVKRISENWYDYYKMSNISISLENAGAYRIFTQYCNNMTELNQIITEKLTEGESGIFFVRGSALYLSSTSLVIIYATAGEPVKKEVLAIICDSLSEYNSTSLELGVYFFGIAENIFVKNLAFDYTDLSYNDDFKGIFKDSKAANVYTLDTKVLSEEQLSVNLVSFITAELGKYKPGDILLVPAEILNSISSGEM